MFDTQGTFIEVSSLRLGKRVVSIPHNDEAKVVLTVTGEGAATVYKLLIAETGFKLLVEMLNARNAGDGATE